jgi:uncharacterized protein (DUF1330 family)
MTAYLVVDIEVRDADKYKEYVAVAPDYVKKHGGKYLVRGGDPDGVEGDWNPQRIVIIEFPTRENARALLDDPEYRSVADARWSSTVSNMIVVDGCGPIE